MKDLQLLHANAIVGHGEIIAKRRNGDLQRQRGNAGFLIYVADAFGYLGSVVVLLWKDFGQAGMSWLEFFKAASYALAAFGALLVAGAMIYFNGKLAFRKKNKELVDDSLTSLTPV